MDAFAKIKDAPPELQKCVLKHITRTRCPKIMFVGAAHIVQDDPHSYWMQGLHILDEHSLLMSNDFEITR